MNDEEMVCNYMRMKGISCEEALVMLKLFVEIRDIKNDLAKSMQRLGEPKITVPAEVAEWTEPHVG